MVPKITPPFVQEYYALDHRLIYRLLQPLHLSFILTLINESSTILFTKSLLVYKSPLPKNKRVLPLYNASFYLKIKDVFYYYRLLLKSLTSGDYHAMANR